MQVIGHSILDDVTWEVIVGASRVADTWNGTTYWASLGFGYAYPSGTLSAPGSGGVRIDWNTSPSTNPAARMGVGHAVTLTAGITYRASLTVYVPNNSVPVRAAFAWQSLGTVSSAWDEPTVIEVKFTPTTTGTYYVGMLTPPGSYYGSATVLDLRIFAGGTDVTDLVTNGLNIRYGRGAYLQDISPASCSFDLRADLATAPSPADWVLVTAYAPDRYSPDSATISSRRFTGQVAAVDYRRPVYKVTATTALSDLNRRTWGNSVTPSENERARFARILGDLGFPYIIQGSSRVTFLARTAEAMKALGYLQDMAFQSGAMLTESRAGLVHIYTAQWFDQAPTITSAEDAYLDHNGLSAANDTAGIINKVTIRYGTDTSPTWDYPTITTQSEVTRSNTSSMTAYGTRWQTYGTELFDAGSATALGDWIINVAGSPRWELEEVTLEASVADYMSPTFWDVATLEAGQAVLIPAATPPLSALMPNYTAILQGWSETITPTRWSIRMSLGRYNVGGLGTITWVEPTGKLWSAQKVVWKSALTLASLT